MSQKSCYSLSFIHLDEILSTRKPPILSEDCHLLTPTQNAETPAPLANGQCTKPFLSVPLACIKKGSGNATLPALDPN